MMNLFETSGKERSLLQVSKQSINQSIKKSINEWIEEWIERTLTATHPPAIDRRLNISQCRYHIAACPEDCILSTEPPLSWEKVQPEWECSIQVPSGLPRTRQSRYPLVGTETVKLRQSLLPKKALSETPPERNSRTWFQNSDWTYPGERQLRWKLPPDHWQNKKQQQIWFRIFDEPLMDEWFIDWRFGTMKRIETGKINS